MKKKLRTVRASAASPDRATVAAPAAVATPRVVWIYLLLALCALASYARVGRFDFVNYDDPVYVSHNPHVREGLSADSLRWAVTSGEGANWFPITRISHLIDAQLFGMQSGWHHLSNVAIHALATLLLFAFLYRATGDRWPSAMVAFLFALHPLHVESVAWVSERKDVLCGLFWMLSLYLWTLGRRRWALLAFCLGLLSKPMIVSLPFLLLLLDIWPLGRVRALTRKQLLLEKAPFFALAAAASIATYLVQQASGAVKSFGAIPLGSRIENALISYVIYIAKVLWPTKLAVFYPYPSEFRSWQALLAGIVLGGISVVVVREIHARPYLAVGWFWYLITLAPVVGIVQVGAQSRADRYLYVPMIGLAIMVAWGAAELLARRPEMKAAIVGAAGVACIACMALTWVQTGYWRDSVALFEHAVEVTQRNDVAQHNLGSALMDSGRLPAAIEHLRAALEINPESATTHTDLGSALSRMPGRLAEGIAEYRAAVRLDARLAIPHANLGSALENVPGELPEAIAESETAVRLDPNLAAARNSLGVALSKAGRAPEAVGQLETAVTLDPGNAEIHNNLGMALAAIPGRLADARAEYRLALGLKPDFEEARNNLGAAMAQDPAQVTDAIAQYEAVLKKDPNSADTQYNLALALAKMPGRLPEAIVHFEASLRLNPANAEAQNNLGFALTNFPARAPEAIGHFEAALRINPNYADAQYNLGVALSNLPGRMGEAIRHFEAAEKLRPDPELEALLRRLRAGQ